MQITFEEAYSQYLKYIELKLKFQSIRKIKSRIENHILPYFKDYNVFEIREIDILTWQSYIENNNFTFSYKKSLHYALVSFLNYCIKYLGLIKNVASIVGNFKNNDIIIPISTFLTIEEFKQFIKNVDNEIYKQFFNLMFYTGTRPGEAMALKFSDLKNNYLRINKTISKECKNGHRVINSPKTKTSNRIICIDDILNKDLYKLLKYYQNKYDDVNYDYYIFGGIKPLSPTTITNYKNKACDIAKIKRIRLHDFRHSHATLLINNNIALKEITRRLGHSKTSTTIDIYIHNDLSQEKKVYNTLNSLRSL